LRVARAHARLGWHWWPQSNAILSATYDGRHPCVQRGTCGSGCNEGAKASTDLTHWPHAIAAGARLVTGARVARLVPDGAGLVRGAEWVDRAGEWHLQPADVVLCAANGVGTARLLLASTSAGFPDGLANSSGLVGRNLMRHPVATATGWFDDSLGTWQGQFGGLICSTEFYATDADRGFARGSKWTLCPTGGPTTAALAADVWGPDHHTAVRERFGRTAMWLVLAEDLPDPENRVVLADDRTDEYGIAVPRVRYRLAENARRLLDWHLERASESLDAAGAWKVEHVRGPGRSGHMMGTARLGTDPAASVVDQWCMAHDVPNLGVVDSSVFVTAGGVNPTSTLCAIARRAAEHLVAHRHDVPRPRHARTFPATARPLRRGGGASSPPAPPAPLDARHRARLRALADVLIPPGDGMPGAGEILDDARVDRAVRALPDAVDLGAVLDRGIDRDAAGWLAELASSDPSAAHAVRVVVAGAYHLDRSVRDALGYPGQEALPIAAREYPAYLLEGLLDGVLGRADR
jgi:choline dehydrogenase-like flavoprotein